LILYNGNRCPSTPAIRHLRRSKTSQSRQRQEPTEWYSQLLNLNIPSIDTQLATPVTSSATKRRYEPSFDDIDTENIDPSLLNSPSKKAKDFYGNPVKPAKVSHFYLKNAAASTPAFVQGRPIITPKRLNTTRSPAQKPAPITTAPLSAPAGRSPKSKRIGILSRRRVSSSPFTRVDPPKFAGSTGGMPFSIDAALSGTVSSYQPEPKPYSTKLHDQIPDSWMFGIYEDSPEDADLDRHSTSIEAVPEDSEGATIDENDRGKENVPPVDYLLSTFGLSTTAAPESRKDMMTDEPRTPLGDLDASEFYAEGCDASSYIIVPAEKSNTETFDALGAKDICASPAKVSASKKDESKDGWKELLAMVEEKKRVDKEREEAAAALVVAQETALPVEEGFEIWEESAKVEVEVTHVEPLEEKAIGTKEVVGEVGLEI
jgi:hypothetical protein